MNLFELENQPLLIEIEPDHKRMVAAIFPLTDKPGILFFDVFWPRASSHPFHEIEGEIRGENPWYVGGHKITLLDRDKEEDRKHFQEWDFWQECRKEDSVTKNTVEDQDFVNKMAREHGAKII